MKTRVTAVLRREVETFGLRFACDDCAHFDDHRETCAHGYPAAPRRDALADGAETVEFCKDFDLGGTDLGGTGVREGGASGSTIDPSLPMEGSR